ncbi:MAG: cation:dicarboxylase symporter family transporter, partial [Bacteroidetes bacterium]|nr:cation:dicarboxylase symporter family transporter [Bacteroidota bacterium]MBU1762047.1 cation:dicarboxylase symporter family transporter [Bacteroidota bacterium]
MKKVINHLSFQVLIAIVLGVLFGIFFPSSAASAKLVSQTFINMITMLIAPIIFFTIVLGIASMDDMKKVGRVGGKALLYFEVITTFAIIIGLIVANVMKPGSGVNMTATDTSKIQEYEVGASQIEWGTFITHIVPHNIVDSFAKGDILQILFFAILFGYGLTKLGAAGTSLISTFNKINKVLFNMMKFVMKLAPLGAFGGIAFTVGTYGLEALLPMGKLMLAVYLTMFLFIFIVLNLVCRLYNFSLWKYLKYI